VTALAPGIAQIDAIAEGKTGTIYITVVPP
jgi:hypothetical protein